MSVNTVHFGNKLLIALLWIALSKVNDAVFIDKPVDAIILQGSPAYFNCSTNSTNSLNNNIYIAWYNSTDTNCANINTPCTVYYSDFRGTTLYPNKTLSSRYQVSSVDSTNGVHIRNLKIISTSSTDAGQYVCYDFITSTFATAQLAVIGGQPRCSINSTMPILPNNTVSMLCQVDINGLTNLGVSLTQGGKILATGNSSTVTWRGLALNILTDNVKCVAPGGISSVQCPTFQVKPVIIAVYNVKSEFIGNDVINCSAVGSSPLSYQWTTNTTVSIAPGPVLVVNKIMAGPVLLRCTVTNNYGNTQTSIATVVSVPATDISISAQDKIHYAGGVITCSAAGYPPPNYTWSDVNNSSIRVSGPVFSITSSMIGVNFSLICTAFNVVGGSLRNISSILAPFTVVGGIAPLPTTTSTKNLTCEYSTKCTDNVSRDAAIAVSVIALISIAVNIAVLLVYIRRKSNKNGRQNQTRSSGTDNVFAETAVGDNSTTYQGLNDATRDTQTPKLYESLYAN